MFLGTSRLRYDISFQYMLFGILPILSLLVDFVYYTLVLSCRLVMVLETC